MIKMVAITIGVCMFFCFGSLSNGVVVTNVTELMDAVDDVNSCGDLEAGLYFLHLRSGDKTVIVKLIKLGNNPNGTR